jgi:hypothetical protein
VVVAFYGRAEGELPVVVQQSTDSTEATASTPSQPTTINKAQVATNGWMPWVTYAVGVIMGMSLTFLIARHGLAFKRAVASGERYVLHHPLLDVTLVSLAIVAYMLLTRAGTIL